MLSFIQQASTGVAMKTEIGLGADLAAYVRNNGVHEHPIAAELKIETAKMGRISGMQITAEQGGFMAFMAKLIGARSYLEIGVFTGYSALVMAQALPEDGKVTALDISAEFTAIGKPFWDRAGVAHKIDLRIAPAADSLAELMKAGRHFDMAFIDADKTGYDTYYEACLGLVRPGGLIAIDNVLWSGKVADPAITDDDTIALRTLNQKIHQDTRVDAVLAPLGDGLYLVRPR
jgi:caffeoyl-CoA O-methyltransferase